MINVIITTIQTTTPALDAFRNMPNIKLILIGDVKTPNCHDIISIDDQSKLNLKSNLTTPLNHYSRKNIGYIKSIQNNASIIYDTDDDNIPLFDSFSPYSFDIDNGDILCSESGVDFVNIYSYFTPLKIWPRGFPISKINDINDVNISTKDYKVGAWQAVVNGDPDVDSIFRLINPTIDVEFNYKNKKIALNSRLYSPFNSQSTMWRKECFPLLYLPITVSFRFTDILRSFVAQRIMWHHGYYLGFHNPIAYQKRNLHNLMKDFKDEVSMFLETENIIKHLNSMKLTDSMVDNLFIAYDFLKNKGVVQPNELSNLTNWISDIKHH